LIQIEGDITVKYNHTCLEMTDAVKKINHNVYQVEGKLEKLGERLDYLVDKYRDLFNFIDGYVKELEEYLDRKLEEVGIKRDEEKKSKYEKEALEMTDFIIKM